MLVMRQSTGRARPVLGLRSEPVLQVQVQPWSGRRPCSAGHERSLAPLPALRSRNLRHPAGQWLPGHRHTREPRLRLGWVVSRRTQLVVAHFWETMRFLIRTLSGWFTGTYVLEPSFGICECETLLIRSSGCGFDDTANFCFVKWTWSSVLFFAQLFKNGSFSSSVTDAVRRLRNKLIFAFDWLRVAATQSVALGSLKIKRVFSHKAFGLFATGKTRAFRL